MTNIPAKCSFCGLVFPSIFSLDGSRNSSVIDCSQICPRCGGKAQIVNASTDTQGRVYLHDLFGYIRNIKNPEKLQELKTHLDAVDDSITAGQFADVLVELDPQLGKFAQLIRSIPLSEISGFIQALAAIVGLLISYYTFQFIKDQQNENIELQKAQYELSKEQFEYQKEKDRRDEAQEKSADELKNKIDKLQSDIEKRIKCIENKGQSSKKIKGSCRNKPCPCGSGLKAKKCHPKGFLV